jgi:hypothetical protein
MTVARPAGVAAATDSREPRARREATRLRHETALLGITAVVSPPLVLVSFWFIGAIAGVGARALTGALEAGVPLAVGITAASMLSAESSLELQLTSPGGFRPAALRRLGLMIVWAGALSLAATVLGRATGVLDSWPGPADPLRDALMSLAPLAAFAVWGCLLGVALRSRGAAAAAVAGFWLAAIAFKDWFLGQDLFRAWYPFMATFAPKDDGILISRFVLLGIAFAGLGILAAWLVREEWLLGSEDR